MSGGALRVSLGIFFFPLELIKACLNFLIREMGDVELNVLKAMCMLFCILMLTQ